MARSRRQKKRTHREDPDPRHSGQKVPKSFVIARGKLPLALRSLEQDVRKLMMPHTALNLKESGKNTLKDFVHVAGPLGVSHFLIMSNTKTAPYLRVAKCPHGPTLTFKIQEYSLAADIARAHKVHRAPPSIFKNPPLVVLNGFNSAEAHLKLVTIMFQNIFPVIDVKTVKLSNCTRVLLLNYNKETKLIDFRHYSISAQPVGVSRGIRKLVQRAKLPDLRSLNDVSEFVGKSGYGSESEAENETSKVVLPQDYGRGNHASQQTAVKLHEVGPRMTLQLVKVEEGLCSGAVMFHEYVKKTPEEIAALKDTFQKRESLRKQRKAEQEANVRRKELLRQQKNRKKGKPEKQQTTDADEQEEDDDAEWYRQEVGQEPDEEFLTGAARKASRSGKPDSKRKPGFRVGKKPVQFTKLSKYGHGGGSKQQKKRSSSAIDGDRARKRPRNKPRH